ncbi:unnamed protein product [Ilex paraguariensis]|uniref:Uncharacterized protein n=1 Tax=Ilex paraguariensis TaxID=185542 RepID=A0ABC8V410_9AQUA
MSCVSGACLVRDWCVTGAGTAGRCPSEAQVHAGIDAAPVGGRVARGAAVIPGVDVLAVGDVLDLQAQVHGVREPVAGTQVQHGELACAALGIGALQVVVTLGIAPGRQLQPVRGLPVHAGRDQVVRHVLDFLAQGGGSAGSGAVMRAT